jgi:hypothetical protein
MIQQKYGDMFAKFYNCRVCGSFLNLLNVMKLRMLIRLCNLLLKRGLGEIKEGEN